MQMNQQQQQQHSVQNGFATPSNVRGILQKNYGHNNSQNGTRRNFTKVKQEPTLNEVVTASESMNMIMSGPNTTLAGDDLIQRPNTLPFGDSSGGIPINTPSNCLGSFDLLNQPTGLTPITQTGLTPVLSLQSSMNGNLETPSGQGMESRTITSLHNL